MLLFFQQHAPELIMILLGCIILFQLLYYFVLFARFSFHKPKKLKAYNQDPVSIVISAKDEAHILYKTLPALLTQQYKEYEVVLVNDNSNDETEQVVMDLKCKYPHLKLVNLNSSVTYIKGKKFPLSLGIKAATYELILLTDADCFPSSPYWLQNMAKHFERKIEIVIGYVAFEKKKGFLNSLIHFASLHSAIQYFSYALAKMPYMGVGKNLAYTKSLFMRQKGFASHNHIKYGEDDIFVNKAANSENVAIEYFKESITITRPKSSFNRWFEQERGRHISRKYYKSRHRFLLSSYELFITLFYISFIFALIFTIHHKILLTIVLSMFAVKTIAQYVIFGFAAKKLEENNLIPFILPFDLLFAILTPFIYLSSLFSKK